MTSTGSAVVAGLAVGIGLILMFANLMKPAPLMSNHEIIEQIRALSQVQIFNRIHSNVTESFTWQENAVSADYSWSRTFIDPYVSPARVTILTNHLVVDVDRNGSTNYMLYCKGSPNDIIVSSMAEYHRGTCINAKDFVLRDVWD